MKKIVLNGIVETNEKAIELYKILGFEIEGLIEKIECFQTKNTITLL